MDCGCGCDCDCDCDSDEGSACDSAPDDAVRYSFQDDRCECGGGSSCPPDSSPAPFDNALDQTAATLNQWQQSSQPTVPGAADGPSSLNPASGNLLTRLGAPRSGPFGPTPILTYNSHSSDAAEFGFGWTATPKQTLQAVDASTVRLTDSSGALLVYTGKDSSGRYRAPGSTRDALVQHSDGSWTQTQPDGFQTRFSSAGQPQWLADSSGGRWTLSYDASSRLRRITDPFSRLTTYAYDAFGYIQRVQDPGGRLTSFTVDAVSGTLTRRVTPDGAITTLLYNGQDQLAAYVDARGQRTSYAYDGAGRAQSITTPSGSRTTYTYVFPGAPG